MPSVLLSRFSDVTEGEDEDEVEWQPTTRDKKQDKSRSTESRQPHEQEYDDVADKYNMTPERLDEIAQGIVR